MVAVALSVGVTSRAAAVPVQDAAGSLARARQLRVEAEDRLGRLQADLAAMQARVDAQFADAAELAAELESAKAEMRRGAVAAYVHGSPDEQATLHLLSGADPLELSRRTTFAASRSLDYAAAAESFEELKRENDPALVRLVEEREALASRVADATDAVFQARANEADAEREAAAAAAAAAQAEAAAQQERARRAAAAAAAADAAATAGRSATSPAPAPSTPAARPPTAPTPSGGRGAVVPLTDLSAPLPDLPPGGPSEEAWAALRRCEASGNYRAVSSSGRYRGAYQFDQQTWESMGGRGDPAAALPIEQDARAKSLYFQRGARAWPHCGRSLG